MPDEDDLPKPTGVAPNNTDTSTGVKVSVWHPETGEKLSVSYLNAHDLITHLGYLRSKPIVIRAETGTVVQTGTATQPPAPVVPPTAPEGPIDLTSLTLDGLVRLAKDKFDIDVASDAKPADIIALIEAEMEATGG